VGRRRARAVEKRERKNWSEMLDARQGHGIFHSERQLDFDASSKAKAPG
jgi:hypothetical protein